MEAYYAHSSESQPPQPQQQWGAAPPPMPACQQGGNYTSAAAAPAAAAPQYPSYDGTSSYAAAPQPQQQQQYQPSQWSQPAAAHSYAPQQSYPPQQQQYYAPEPPQPSAPQPQQQPQYVTPSDPYSSFPAPPPHQQQQQQQQPSSAASYNNTTTNSAGGNPYALPPAMPPTPFAPQQPPQQQQPQYYAPPPTAQQPQQPQGGFDNSPIPPLPRSSGVPSQQQQQQQQQYYAQPQGGPAVPTTPIQQPMSGTNSSGPSFATPTQPGTNGSFSGRPPATPSANKPQQPQQQQPAGEQGQRARPTAGNARINASRVPSPCRDLPQDTAGANRPRFLTSTAGNPPLAVTRFVGQDDGCANPKFLRPTLHCIPHDASFVKESNVPFGVVLAPLSEALEPEEQVPVITGRAPVRCKRCRAYINPQVQFIQLGRIWVCCYCDMQNEVSTEYFCNLDGNNRRRDALEKAELSRGSVEYDVDGLEEYALKNEQGQPVPTRPMHHLFLIDVSKNNAALTDLVDSLRNTLQQMATLTPQCKVSFFTYASTLHFYNFKHPSVPQLIVPDVENPFVPLPFTLLCWMALDTDMEKILSFLDRLEAIRAATDEDGCAAGAAVKAASLILTETGGRVILTANHYANIGTGAIKPRELSLYGTDKEKQLFKPMDGFWTSMALELAKKNISVDMLLFSTEYSEFVTMGQLAHVTNGSQTLFVNYSSEKDQLRLQSTLDRSLLEEGGYAAITRVRTSNGLRVKGYSGHFLAQDPHDMDLATVQGSSTFFVDLAHEGSKLDIKGREHVQCAMLYTTRSGSRRVRVHSLAIPVSNTYQLLFKNADLEACVFAHVQTVIADAVNKGLKAAHEGVTDRLIKMLIAYRKFCEPSANSGLLLMPEPLRLLAVFILCLGKSDALIQGTSVRLDERTRCMHELVGMPISRLLWYIYPRFYAVHNLLTHPTAGTIHPQTNQCQLPTLQQLTADVVMTHGIYLLHDQQAKLVYLWIGSRVAPRVSQALFGVDDAAQVARTVPVEQFHPRLKNVIDSIRMSGLGGGMDRLLVVHEKERSEDAFFRNMLEDENVPGTLSYPDLLCKFHQKVCQAFT